MNNTPNATDSQVGLNPDQAAASLAFSTFISQQLMPKPEATQTQEMGQGEEQIQEPQEAPPQEEAPQETQDIEPDKMEEMKKGMDEFKGEVKGIIESKFDDLTKTLKDALKDD